MHPVRRLLAAVALAGVCCGPGGGEAEEGETWDADSICDQPGLEWACEEVDEEE